MHRKLCIEYARAFCFSLTMSPTSILNGCIAMLILVSRNINDTSPNTMAVDTAIPNDPALGSRHITITATSAPMNR